MTIIKRDTICGIYNTTFRAEIGPDKIKLTTPYIKWVGGNGNLAFSNSHIRNPAIVSAINKALAGEYPEHDRYGDAYEDADDYIFRALLDI